MPPASFPPDWLDPMVVNLLTGLAIFLASCALGGWMAWRRRRSQFREGSQQMSRKQDTEST
jgi:hypothetical protein